MLGNSKMDVDQLNRCVKHYQFLSPRLKTSGFSNYTQRTECSIAQQHTPQTHSTSEYTARWSSPFSRLFTSWRASCEAASATGRIEQAQESLKQKGLNNTSIVSELEIQNYLAQETGKDRLIKMFTRDHMGKASPEFNFTYQVTFQAAGVAFLVMSFLAGRQAKQEFIDRNRATVFKTRFQAFRRLNDQIFMFSLKEGMKWALRVTLFSLSFMGISQSIAVYRNKSSPWEYAIASGTTIGALKANMGLRGFLVSTGFGFVIGTFMGFMVLGAMRGLNETQEQRHYWAIQKELEKEKYYASKGKLEAVTGL